MNRNIVIVGLVSLFTDISSEMIYPLIPLYLTAVLGASPSVLGVIEGIAESLASLLKIFSGRISDRFEKRKSVAVVGYGLSALGKVLFVVATSWVGVLWARIGDRFGKGIRTAPRDALIAESVGPEARGRAFGFHRAMDTAGAVIGIITAYWLFTSYRGEYLLVFWLALIPAVLGVFCLFFASETGQGRTAAKQAVFSWRGLDKKLRYFIIVTFLFNLGNSSNQFLLVRAGTSGFSPEQVILLYLLMNLTYFAISYPAGIVSDAIGRRSLLVAGYALYGLVYLGFGFASLTWQFIALFAVYGLYTGMTDGIEKALLADIAPPGQRATVYGLHAMTVGFALLPASLIAGLLWDAFGAAAPFWFGGVTGLLSAGAFWLGLRGT
ncbi:MAG: MFS transporter [Negativicutes bacterium]|nr:MFS transporter [Negativicutes bacterium]